MIDNRLIQSGYLAIPLKVNVNSTLNPQPNWLVIENIFSKINAYLPSLGDTICAQSLYKIVYREILPYSPELNRLEEMREISYEYQNQPIPLSVVPAFSSYELLLQNKDQINFLLSLFQFRGILEGFQLIIDEDKINKILEPEPSPTPTPTPTPTPEIL